MADELVSRVTGHAITGCDTYGAPTYATHPESEDLDGDETDDRATGPARTGTTPAEAATDKPDRSQHGRPKDRLVRPHRRPRQRSGPAGQRVLTPGPPAASKST